MQWGSRVAVTRWSAHLPQLPAGTRLAGWEPGDGVPPEDAAEVLGRKGLLAKEPATRLALCAVHRALGLPPRAPRRGADTSPDPGTAVVVSSNLGNCATVAGAATAVRDEGVRAVSPLDAPNASSNVISSSIAIWFGFGGPNLMVCSGQPGGLDAVALGTLLLTAGRARRVVVVGVEPGDPVATALLGADGGPPLRQAAACVLLEPVGYLLLDPVEDLVREKTPSGPATGTAGGHTAPDGTPAELVLAPQHLCPDQTTVDLTATLGATYGALGVLQVAVAAAVLAEHGGAATIVCGDAQDGYRTTRLSRQQV
jgi:3-oxoacyl-[acyl-carrier-protein] synthase II